MNHGTMKLLCITLFLWIGFPLSATAAEAEAGTGASAPAAAGTVESAPAASGTVERAPAAAGTVESAPTASGTGESVKAEGRTGVSAKAESGSGQRTKAEVGTGTTQWLDIQREGRVPGNLLPIPGAEAGLSYRRYINSFNRPIPDKLLTPAPVSNVQ